MFRSHRNMVITVLFTGLLGGCGSDTSDLETPDVSQTFSATMTMIEIVRSADEQQMPVTGLPEESSEITVSP